jgi:hypothetical protein
MSGLLQRLAGQALGGQVSGTPPIRPAASVHAQVPMGIPQEAEGTRPLLGTAPDAPRLAEQDERAAAPVARGPMRNAETAHRSIETVHEATSPPARAHATETRGPMPPAAHGYAARLPSHDSSDRAPQPLLEETQAASVPPAIAPASPPVQTLNLGHTESRAEPTEVHVHIGRIEVIAAPEPAAPKKVRHTATRNTRPLDEYLARRRPS